MNRKTGFNICLQIQLVPLHCGSRYRCPSTCAPPPVWDGPAPPSAPYSRVRVRHWLRVYILHWFHSLPNTDYLCDQNLMMCFHSSDTPAAEMHTTRRVHHHVRAVPVVLPAAGARAAEAVTAQQVDVHAVERPPGGVSDLHGQGRLQSFTLQASTKRCLSPATTKRNNVNTSITPQVKR
jgi:hypothetical protein